MQNGNRLVTLTERNFHREVLDTAEPVVVDFWAAWCGPCLMVSPAISELAVEFAGHAKVGKVNVDDEPALAMRYGIRSIPAILFFQDGKIVDQVVGAVPKEALAEKLRRLLPVSE